MRDRGRGKERAKEGEEEEAQSHCNTTREWTDQVRLAFEKQETGEMHDFKRSV